MLDAGFEPVLGNQCRLLVLGSLPGKTSIQKQQYYGHPRNAFWPIMQALLGIDCTDDYKMRMQLLQNKQIGLWDVYAKASRAGSLDSAIDKNSAAVNDFESVFKSHRELTAIAFNGKLAYQQFLKLGIDTKGKTLLPLPSTSPAYAAMAFSEKLQQWREILQYVE